MARESLSGSDRGYDIYSDNFRRQTYATFASMREQDPVWRMAGHQGNPSTWFVTRYDDAIAVLHDDHLFTRDLSLAVDGPQSAQHQPLRRDPIAFVENHMLSKDGDDHRRLRRLVGTAFTPRLVEHLRPRIEENADELISGVEGRGEMDMVNEFAFLLPMKVIAELLGIPLEDRDRFRHWSQALLAPPLVGGGKHGFEVLVTEFVTYLLALIDKRRREPAGDLITALTQVEEAGDVLSEEELVSMIVLLIIAGHETTVGLLGNAVVALLDNAKQLARLRCDSSLMTLAIDELIRYDGPAERALPRWATADTMVRDQLIRRGETVVVLLGAANRDPHKFPSPDTLDVARGNATKHLGFGYGRHYCLGAPLARLEAEIALQTLFRRLPNLRLRCTPNELRWRHVPLQRTFASVPVAWG